MSWFPIPDSLLFDNRDWQGLTTTAKAMMLCCMSQANLNEGRPFYRSDFDWCVRLADCPKPYDRRPISLNTVRRARYRLAHDLDWIQIKPGTRVKGRPLATRYLSVLHSAVPTDGQHWTQMPRYAFENILRDYGPKTAIAYVYLTAYRRRHAQSYDEKKYFFIGLGTAREQSGLEHFYEIVFGLSRDFKFKNGEPLFTIEGIRNLKFSNWGSFNEDGNAEAFRNRQLSFKDAVRQLKDKLSGKMPQPPRRRTRRRKESIPF